jgi:hypothetical protein
MRKLAYFTLIGLIGLTYSQPGSAAGNCQISKNIFETKKLVEDSVSSILEHTTPHGAIEGETQVQQRRNSQILRRKRV